MMRRGLAALVLIVIVAVGVFYRYEIALLLLFCVGWGMLEEVMERRNIEKVTELHRLQMAYEKAAGVEKLFALAEWGKRLSPYLEQHPAPDYVSESAEAYVEAYCEIFGPEAARRLREKAAARSREHNGRQS
jgi:hypothetical protein